MFIRLVWMFVSGQAASRAARPLGVTILAVLGFLLAAYLIVLGVAVTTRMPIAEFMMRETSLSPEALAAVLLVLGGIVFLVGWGLWTGRRWAWWVVVVLQALRMLGGFVSILQDFLRLQGAAQYGGIMGRLMLAEAAGALVAHFILLLIDVTILYYLFEPHVKGFFGVKVLSSA